MKNKLQLTRYLISNIESWYNTYDMMGTPIIGDEQLNEIIRLANKCSEEEFEGTLEERREQFVKEVNDIANQDSYWFNNNYSLGKFIDFWASYTPKTRLLPFEKKIKENGVFSIKGRLNTWKSNNQKNDTVKRFNSIFSK